MPIKNRRKGIFINLSCRQRISIAEGEEIEKLVSPPAVALRAMADGARKKPTFA
jgi:hypothetical protein